ncbi:MAG: flagellar biosynthesis anti-sigma factor FlgM [Anaerolineales bacterium]
MANDITSLTNGRTQHTGDRQVHGIQRDETQSDDRGPKAGVGASSDKVSLTSTAARLKALEQKLATQPDVDMDKVSQVKSAISDGKYTVDPHKIADKMMDFEEKF